MRIVRTQRAMEGFREVAEYIAGQFGNKALTLVILPPQAKC